MEVNLHLKWALNGIIVRQDNSISHVSCGVLCSSGLCRQGPKLYILSNKKNMLMPWQNLMSFVCFSLLFWSKQVHFKPKIDSFYTFILINFLVTMLQCTETLILYLFCTWYCEKKPSKVGYISNIADFFSITLMTQSAPKNKDTRFFWVF